MSRVPLEDRLADLEAQLVSLRAELAGVGRNQPRFDAPRPIRWARTVEGDTDYPTAASNPNTYPIVFLDGTYTQAQGAQTPTWTDRQSAAATVVHNVATDAYIAVGTVIPVWYDRGRWWTDWHYTNVHHVEISSGSITPGATASIALPTGRVVTATNWSADTTLTSGDRCLCFQDEADGAWYLIKTGGGGGGSGGSRVWRAVAVDDIDPVPNTNTGTVTLSTGVDVEARHYLDTYYILSGDYLYVTEDAFDGEKIIIPAPRKVSRVYKAEAYENFDGTDATFRVTNVMALDGRGISVIVSDDPLEVENPFKMAGVTGDYVHIREDWSDPEGATVILVEVQHHSQEVLKEVLPDSATDVTKIQYKKRTVWAVCGADDTSTVDCLTLQDFTFVTDSLVDSPTDTTAIQKKTHAVRGFPTTASESAATAIVTLVDQAIDVNVKLDNGTTPTKLQQTKKTIKRFPTTNSDGDSDVANIAACP